eukprot:TRINITY_DN108725_c0_g1_i1.p1 TRINITY_DN108725_c0_g1~~TRINITY_DN108725_c0_g1_i1.p1  ORF type:complete len:237 (+),score=7.59 TRINITY_DN108725_c0_g1_i1:30-740(+)
MQPWVEAVLLCVVGIACTFVVISVPCLIGHPICDDFIPTLSTSAEHEPATLIFACCMAVASLLNIRVNNAVVVLVRLYSKGANSKWVTIQYVVGTWIASPALFMAALAPQDHWKKLHLAASCVAWLGFWFQLYGMLAKLPKPLVSPAIRNALWALFIIGILACWAFGYLFCAVHKLISNPMGFTKTSEAFAEAVTAITQFGFMGLVGIGPLRKMQYEVKATIMVPNKPKIVSSFPH